MDRTVYFNPETCSNFSEDSYYTSKSPVTSTRSIGGDYDDDDYYTKKSNIINKTTVYNNSTQKPPRTTTGSFDRFKVHTNNNNNNPRDSIMRRAINEKLSLAQHHKGQGSSRSRKGGGSQQLVQQQHQGQKWSKLQEDRPLTKKLIHSGISRIAIPRSTKDRDEDIDFNYGSVLVLHLQCKNITTMTPTCLDPFYNLKNLYLYKNNIRRIQGLDSLVNLELLDLSRNNVERIDNLDKCRSLRKLYLGFNEIQVVEGLESLDKLEELLLDDQDIPPEQPLIFIPGIMIAVANSLVQLDISSNQLSSLRPISDLPKLQLLVASNNLLDDMEETLSVLETFPHLECLNLKGNPIASKPNYKSKIIGVVYRLESLDGKDISDATRSCVQKLRYIKEIRAKQREEAELMRQMKSETIKLKTGTAAAAAPSPYKLDPNYIHFDFSTPTRASPNLVQATTMTTMEQKQQQVLEQPHLTTAVTASESLSKASSSYETQQQMLEQSVYESRARTALSTSHGSTSFESHPGDDMSDMAKIIFRLSNLDDPGNSPAMDGSGDAKSILSSYWDQPGCSLAPECRALSPLEGEIDEKVNKSTSSSTHQLIRPKPAGPGGRSNNNNTNQSFLGIGGGERYVYGRTLSPLIEMPTPESLTARDEN